MNFLYPDLSPKPRFLKILELHIMPELEKGGFKLLKSGPTLKRVEDGFEWLIEFDGRKFNVENFICRFNPYFAVRNSNYRKFIRSKPDFVKGSRPLAQIGNTSGIRHWDKKIFSTDDSEAYFLEDNDFAKYDNLHLVDEMIKNIRTVGIPYFKMMSNFDSIRNFYFHTGQLVYAPMLVDMCYVLNKEDQIQSIFDWYYKSNDNCAEWLDTKMASKKENWLKQNP